MGNALVLSTNPPAGRLSDKTSPRYTPEAPTVSADEPKDLRREPQYRLGDGRVRLIGCYIHCDLGGRRRQGLHGYPAFGFAAFFGADMLVAAAATAAGAALGFVFGIPRTLDPASRAAVAAAAERTAAADSHALLAANTNLERISDWLTTLLIGATLVQIKDIAAWVGSLGKNLTTGGAAANDAVIPIIVIYYVALSFLGVYLITRLYLTSAFENTLGMLLGREQAAQAGGGQAGGGQAGGGQAGGGQAGGGQAGGGQAGGGRT